MMIAALPATMLVVGGHPTSAARTMLLGATGACNNAFQGEDV